MTRKDQIDAAVQQHTTAERARLQAELDAKNALRASRVTTMNSRLQTIFTPTDVAELQIKPAAANDQDEPFFTMVYGGRVYTITRRFPSSDLSTDATGNFLIECDGLSSGAPVVAGIVDSVARLHIHLDWLLGSLP